MGKKNEFKILFLMVIIFVSVLAYFIYKQVSITTHISKTEPLKTRTSLIGTVQEARQVTIGSQDYIDKFIDWQFTEINNTHWTANFVFIEPFFSDTKRCLNNPQNVTCWDFLKDNYFQDYNLSKVRRDLLNLTNYPLKTLTKDISFSNFNINLTSGTGNFYIIFPNGFKEGERAEFGFGTTQIGSTSSTPFQGNQKAVCRTPNRIHAIWRGSSNELIYSNSSDGVTWSNTTLNGTAKRNYMSTAPAIACEGNNVVVVWVNYTTTKAEFFYRNSTDEGATWNSLIGNSAPVFYNFSSTGTWDFFDTALVDSNLFIGYGDPTSDRVNFTNSTGFGGEKPTITNSSGTSYSTWTNTPIFTMSSNRTHIFSAYGKSNADLGFNLLTISSLTVADAVTAATANIGGNGDIDITKFNKTIYIGYFSGGSVSDYLHVNSTDGGTTWGTAVTVYNGDDTSVAGGLSITNTSNNLYYFYDRNWTKTINSNVVYRMWNISSGWTADILFDNTSAGTSTRPNINSMNGTVVDILFLNTTPTPDAIYYSAINEVAAGADSTPPTFSNMKANTTVANAPVNFSIVINDETGLSGYIFETNNTGTFVNTTWVSLASGGTAQNITTLNSTGGVLVNWTFYANDTNNNWAVVRNWTTTTDTQAPRWSNNQTNSTIAGTVIKHSVNWTDDTALNNTGGYIFSFDNGTSTFVNDSFIYFGEIPHNSSDWRNRLVGMWHLNNDTKDYSEKGNDGTQANGVNCSSAVSGKFGTACWFDGTDDNIALPSLGIPENGTVTQMAWIYLRQAASAKGARNDIFYNLYQHNANDWIYILGTNDFFEVIPSTNTWHHIVLNYSGDTSTATLYLDGVKYGISVQAPAEKIPAPTYIGWNGVTAGSSFSGTIDEVAIWNRSLSATEISTLYNMSKDFPTSAWSNVTKGTNSSGNLKWRVYANDTSNNWNSTDIFSYNITDSTAPTFSNMNANTTVANTPVNFSVVINDETGLSGYIFETNNTGNYVNTTWFNVTGNSTYTADNITTLNSTGGVLVNWTFYANDTNNNWAVVRNWTTTTDATKPTWSNNQTNGTTAGAFINHSVVLNDETGLSYYIFEFYNGSGTGTTTATITLNESNKGNVGDTWTREDDPTGNNGGDTSIQVIGGSVPDNRQAFIMWNLSVVPSGSTITNANMSLDLTGFECSDTHAAYNTTNNWGETNLTWNNQPWGDKLQDSPTVTGTGWWYWNVTNAAIAQFSQSNKNMSITINGSTYCWDYYDSKESTTVAQRPQLKITYTTAGADTGTNITNMSISGTQVTANQTVKINSTVGSTIRWRYYFNDTSNNWNSTDLFNYTTTDGTPPTWSNNQTSIPSQYSSALSIFNITWTDETQFNVSLIELNYTGTATNYTMTKFANNVYNFNLTLPAGTFYWKSYGNDSNNNWNVSDTWYFTINKGTMSLSITSSQSVTYPTQTTVTGSETNAGDGDVTYQLYRNSSATNPLSSTTETATLGAGVNLYTYNTTSGPFANWTANTTGITTTVTVNQNSTNPVDIFFINSTSTYKNQNITVSSGEVTTANATMVYPNAGTASLFEDGSSVSNPRGTTLSVGAHSYKGNITGNVNYTDNSTGVTYYIIVNQVTISIDLNATKMWWNDSVNLSGYAASGGSPFSGWIQVNRSNDTTTMCNITTSNGYYSCVFYAPLDIGNFNYTSYVLNANGTILAGNSTILTVMLSYGSEYPGKNVAVYEAPVIIQELGGKIKIVWVKIKTWFNR